MPPTITDFLRSYDAHHLQPRPADTDQAVGMAVALVDDLLRHPTDVVVPVDGFLQGSQLRRTAIAPIHDVDMVVVLDPAALATRAGANRQPQTAIQALAAAVRQAPWVRRRGVTLRNQDHSVGVMIPNGPRVDIVPAVRLGGDLKIPERSAHEWISIDRQAASMRLGRVEGRCPDVRVAVRLLKAWRRGHAEEVPLPSYAMEVLVVHLAESHRDLAQLVGAAFDSLAGNQPGARLQLRMEGGPVHRPITLIDPNTGRNLTGGVTAAARDQVRAAARRAVSAFAELRAQEPVALGGRGRAPRLASTLFAAAA